MHENRWRQFLGVVLTGVPLLIAGCATRPAPVLTIAPPPLPPPPLVPAAGTVPVSPPKIRALSGPLFPWMVVSEFYPLGCRPIVPKAGYVAPALVETPRAWFPSVVECRSPQGDWMIGHFGEPRGDEVEHFIFARRGVEPTGRLIFTSRRTLEVLWSPDGRWVAVTVLIGHNRSIVQLVDMQEMKLVEPISAAEALRDYLTPVQIGAPQFLMALRWTEKGELVLRARGQEVLEPFTVFGYELLVDPAHLETVSAVRFLRGYTRRAKPAEQAASGT